MGIVQRRKCTIHRIARLTRTGELERRPNRAAIVHVHGGDIGIVHRAVVCHLQIAVIAAVLILTGIAITTGAGGILAGQAVPLRDDLATVGIHHQGRSRQLALLLAEERNQVKQLTTPLLIQPDIQPALFIAAVADCQALARQLQRLLRIELWRDRRQILCQILQHAARQAALAPALVAGFDHAFIPDRDAAIKLLIAADRLPGGLEMAAAQDLQFFALQAGTAVYAGARILQQLHAIILFQIDPLGRTGLGAQQ